LVAAKRCELSKIGDEGSSETYDAYEIAYNAYADEYNLIEDNYEKFERLKRKANRRDRRATAAFWWGIAGTIGTIVGLILAIVE
jgi:hypothetical protein